MNVLDLFGSLSWEAAGIAGSVLVLVYALKGVKLVKTGNQARLTTALIAALLTGVDIETANALTPVVATLAAGGFEIIDYIWKQWLKYKAKQDKG